MPGIERDVAVLAVASVADRNRTDTRRDNPVHDHADEQSGGKPDPAEPPAHEERRTEREGHDETAEALIEILLHEEGPVAAEQASLDSGGAEDAGRPHGIGPAAALARRRGVHRLRELARREATRTVVAGPQGYAGKPVATVR